MSDIIRDIEYDGGEVIIFSRNDPRVEEVRLGYNADDRLVARMAADSRFTDVIELLARGTKISDAGCRDLLALKSLAYLNISQSNVSDAGLISLFELPRLISLNIDDCRVSGTELQSSSIKCIDLKSLVVSRTSFTTATLTTILSVCRKLTHVYAQISSIDRSAIEALNQLPELIYVNIIETDASPFKDQFRAGIYVNA